MSFAQLSSTMPGSWEMLIASLLGSHQGHLPGKEVSCFLAQPPKFYHGWSLGDTDWFSTWLNPWKLTRNGGELLCYTTSYFDHG